MAKVSSGVESRLVTGDSPADVRSETDHMRALGYTPSAILWSEVAEEWYEWWYRNPTVNEPERGAETVREGAETDR